MSLEKLLKINSEVYTIDAEFIDKTIKKLNLDKDSKILELGTGFGTMTTILALNDFNVVTGEPEDECHHDWRKAAKALGVEHKIKYQYLDAENLKLPAGSIDVVVMHFTLEHIKKKELAIKECLKVVKTNGKVIIIQHSEKGIEYFQNTTYQCSVPPQPVNPKDSITEDYVSLKVINGTYVNIFILSKIH